MRQLLFSFLVLALVAPPAVAQTPRAPTGRWIVVFDDASCVAMRDYGGSSRPLKLALKAPIMGDVMQIGIIESGPGKKGSKQTYSELWFDGASAYRGSNLSFATAKPPQRVHLINIPSEATLGMARATSMRMQTKGEIDAQLQLSQMPDLLKTMASCVTDLRQHWNVWDQPGPNPRLSRLPISDLSGTIRADDYPDDAISAGEEGSLQVILLVGPDGRVADCTILKSAGPASLDVQSCSKIRDRARFRPALDLNGKPTRAVITQRITFRIA